MYNTTYYRGTMEKLLDFLNIYSDEPSNTDIFEIIFDWLDNDLRHQYFGEEGQLFKNLEEFEVEIIIKPTKLYWLIATEITGDTLPLFEDHFKADDWTIAEIIEFIHMLEVWANDITMR